MSRLLFSILVCLFCAGHHIVATAAAGTIDIPSRTGSSNPAFTFISLPSGVTGAESLVFDPSGQGPYTGVSDGRILKWDDSTSGWTTFARSGGRPLGLQFNIRTGDLYIADFVRGLLRVGPTGGEAEVVAANFAANGLDVDQSTGDVYFTDDSSTGRLMKYDAQAKNVTVLEFALPWPNGVAVSTDGTHVLVTHTGSSQLFRYWLHGPKAGSYEFFVKLPGIPDNIRRDGRGGYWVAAKGVNILEDAIVGVRLDTEGMVLEKMTAKDRSVILSEVTEKDDKLWLGSNFLDYVIVVDQTRL